MRKDGVLSFILGDHLGSTSLVTDANGTVISQQYYKAWGETRYASGTEQTKYQYTGQYSDSYINLLWYGSRHYDPALGRFIQPDSIVPNPSNPQSLDRYGYVLNNPVRYTDPSGHRPCDDVDAYGICITYQNVPQYDVTEFLVEEMQGAGEEGLQLTETYNEQGGLFFVYSYMFGKYWRYGPKNIKVAMEERIGKGVILCGGDGCRWVDYSTPGNILFGYAAEAASMSEEFYSWVGGFEQIGEDMVGPESVQLERCSTSYCDDPYDLAAVQFGAQLYREYKSEIITLDIFQTELTTDVLETFQPPPSSFIAPFSPHPQNNYYHMGDFDYGH